MGNEPEEKAFKPNSKRSTRCQASPSEKKALGLPNAIG
jgi:hypothetical protein